MVSRRSGNYVSSTPCLSVNGKQVLRPCGMNNTQTASRKISTGPTNGWTSDLDEGKD